MKETKDAAFDPAIFLANAGVGRRIVRLKAKEAFLLRRRTKPIASFIFRPAE